VDGSAVQAGGRVPAKDTPMHTCQGYLEESCTLSTVSVSVPHSEQECTGECSNLVTTSFHQFQAEVAHSQRLFRGSGQRSISNTAPTTGMGTDIACLAQSEIQVVERYQITTVTDPDRVANAADLFGNAGHIFDLPVAEHT